MKKLVLLLSFVFVMGLISVNAQDPKKPAATKTPVKTEQTTKKKAGKSKKGKTDKKKKAAATTATTPKAAK